MTGAELTAWYGRVAANITQEMQQLAAADSAITWGVIDCGRYTGNLRIKGSTTPANLPTVINNYFSNAPFTSPFMENELADNGAYDGRDANSFAGRCKNRLQQGVVGVLCLNGRIASMFYLDGKTVYMLLIEKFRNRYFGSLTDNVLDDTLAMGLPKRSLVSFIKQYCLLNPER